MGRAIGPFEILIALLAVNLAAFAAFGIDKVLAENKSRRISEATLLQLAFFGGIGGAYAGRSLFRHKTRKQPFSTHLGLIAGFQLCAIVFAAIYFW
ncbi:DUF1294 domain-containing protein [Qipengyuania nanhaisediminis]|uniref:DUF1294 domain-containing protein n=1 Tax=Qipengyuania nanhaisediminis TaxID=604088 RepID=UPI0038B25E22